MASRLTTALGLVAAVGLLGACTPGTPEAAVEVDVTGDLRTHDPGLVVGDGDRPWFIFSTGDPRVGLGAIQVRTSPDGQEWTYAGEAWAPSDEPRWALDRIPGVENFWAPEVFEHGGTWYLYYAASTFGSNTSTIGLRTTSELDAADPAASWTDQGEVIGSGRGDNFNAIDPAVIVDENGQGWLAFGSFWGGIQMVGIDFPSGKPAPDAEPITVAHRGTAVNAVEAPALLHRDGWYYLFLSFDSCCQGTASTYNINVGRSRDASGPYVDVDGVALTEGGGTLLLETRGTRIGPGGQSVSGNHIAFHFYDEGRNGDFQLAIRELGWNDEGWPVVALED